MPALAVALALGSSCDSEPSGLSARPNVVLFLVDDLGWSDVGYNGSTFHRTPVIDDLAARGVVFSRAYAASPVCSPTRASILTGRYPARGGITKALLFADYAQEAAANEKPDKPRRRQRYLQAQSATFIPFDEPTLGARLQDAGYRTVLMGKWHLGHTPYSADRYGFDEVVGGGIHAGPESFFPPYGIPNLADGAKGEYLTDRLADEAAAFIRRSSDRPFFLFLSYFAVHNPYIAKPDDVAEFAREMDLGAPQKNPKYAAMIKAVDDSVGTIVAALEESGVAENTVLIFTSDNGALEEKNVKVNGEPTVYPVTSNLPLRDGKGSLYEGGTRVPFFAYWPGIESAGRTLDAPIISMDLFATILDLAGVPNENGTTYADGRSLLPLMRGGEAPERDALFFHYPHGKLSSSVIVGPHKLLRFWNGRTELYDLEADVGESDDIAGAHPDIVARLDARLSSWLEEVGAPLPEPNPAYVGN